MKHAILMADVIGSSKRKSQKLITQFQNLVALTNDDFKKNLHSPLTITLGDEFQGIAITVTSAIKIIIYIEEKIIELGYDFKLRYILNYGDIETPINKKIAYNMLGKGLTEAREKITLLKNTENRFCIDIKSKLFNDRLNNAFIVYQTFVDDWKIIDFKMIILFIQNQHYKEVANAIGINESSAWRREKSLKIKQYFATKNLIFSLTKK